MKKRITSIILAACMFLLCSCGDKNPAKVGTGNVKTENQYVIAMNPSVAFEDGTVSSLRNDAARAIARTSVRGNMIKGLARRFRILSMIDQQGGPVWTAFADWVRLSHSPDSRPPSDVRPPQAACLFQPP